MSVINTLYGQYQKTSKKRLDITFDYEHTTIQCFRDLSELLGIEALVDVGSNIGVYSVFCSDLSTITAIYPVEADPFTYQELLRNCELQVNSCKFSPLNLAAHSECAELKFRRMGELAGHSGVVDTFATTTKENNGIEISVDAVRLDDRLSLNDCIAAVKIDVEGHEIDALKGLERTLTEMTGFVQIEILTNGDGLSTVKDIMQSYGYIEIARLKNDFIFLKACLVESYLSKAQALIFDRVSQSLTRLMKLNRKERKHIRELKAVVKGFAPGDHILNG